VIKRLKNIISDEIIKGNERAYILAKEGSTSGTLFQDQARLTTVNTSEILHLLKNYTADRMAGKME
jgi:hypothetical protein